MRGFFVLAAICERATLTTVILQDRRRFPVYCPRRGFPMNPGPTPVTASVLTSWKDIAGYMGKGVRTVQRWEQDFGLPIRRPIGTNKKAVLARPHDLDAWVAMRCSSHSSCAMQDETATGALLIRSRVAANVETSRMLRTMNQSARGELHHAILSLKEQLERLWSLSVGSSTGTTSAILQEPGGTDHDEVTAQNAIPSTTSEAPHAPAASV